MAVNFYYSVPYQDLKKEGDELQEKFIKTREKIQKYPDDQDFNVDLLKISEKRNEVQKKLVDLKSEVIRLAETFTKIPINTERLKLARQHFEAGDYQAAQAVLDAEQMGNELDALLQQKTQLQEQQAENQAQLITLPRLCSRWLVLLYCCLVETTPSFTPATSILYVKPSVQ